MTVGVRSAAATLLATLVFVYPNGAAATPCATLLPSKSIRHSAHPIGAADVATLRDISGFGFVGMQSPFSVSPDGSKLAVVVRQPDPATNTFCVGVVVISIDGSSGVEPVLVDQQHEGDSPGPGFAFNSRVLVPIGTGLPNVPSWSPDGKWLVYLRRDGDTTQAWRARTDGTGSNVVTRSAVDVESVGWTEDGRGIVYASRPGRTSALLEIEKEGRSGFYFDKRFRTLPPDAGRPQAPENIPIVYTTIDVDTLVERLASDGDAQPLISPDMKSWPTGTLAQVEGPDGWVARIVQEMPDRPFSRKLLRVTNRNGDVLSCDAETCTNVAAAWWLGTGSKTELYFTRLEGWARSQVGLYRWHPGHGSPSRVLRTDGLLMGCQSHREQFLCAYEAATSPRRIVRVEPGGGAMSVVFDPNPQTSEWRFGRTERLHWASDAGTQTFGDLVLPPNHRDGDHHPLIVVSYISRGFLRGGSGDEYPIHALATRGFAVLSFHRPEDLGQTLEAKSGRDAERANLREWQDRRNVHSALMKGIDLASSRGPIDESRIGITGMSEGSAIAQWAILNSDRFAAAAMSSCCASAVGTMALQGPDAATVFKGFGYPSLHAEDHAFWDRLALDRNVRNLRVPLLLQIPESEYLLTVSAVAVARELDKPVDLFVFPNEPHLKWQPAHKLAIYQRGIDWFDFWLKGQENTLPGRPTEYARWRAWRARLQRSESGSE